MSWKSVLFNPSRFSSYLQRTDKVCHAKNILKLEERGMYVDLFPADSSNRVFDLVTRSPQTVYAGFDPTADSLHIGNLLVLQSLFHWQRLGHKVIILIGGATARVGDPSGKTKERKRQQTPVLQNNASELERLLNTIIQNHESIFYKTHSEKLHPIKIVNNAEWYDNMSALEFIGNVGRHFRVGTMLGKQSVRERMNSGAGISYTEFSYQILQAYDWLHLYERYGCNFQIGGNDQQGNIVAGYDLIQRIHNKMVFGLTVPIVTNEEGDKYGKTGGNAIWLSGDKTSPFQFYQFLIRTKDSEVENLLKLFSFESVQRISEIMAEHKNKPEKRLAQKILANEVTTLVHGEQGLQQAERITSTLYDRNSDALHKLSASDIQSAFEGASLIKLLLKPGTTILEAALDAGCFKNEADAMRVISAGGFYINQQRATNVEEIVTPASHILPNNITLMRVGKRHYYIVQWL